MSKFKVGDEVVCVNTGGSKLTVGKKYKVYDITRNDVEVINDDGDDCYYYLSSFELVQEKEQMFDMKTNPWFIRVNNEQEFEAAKEWVEVQGVNWTDWVKDKSFNSEIGALCSNLYDFDNYYWLGHDEVETQALYGRKEIKLTFKTVVDSVEYPVLESEQQKKIRELKETIEKASAQIAEIEKEMK